MRKSDVFLDTNILVYAVSEDNERSGRSKELVARGGVVSVQVLNEFIAVSRRKSRAPWEMLETSVSTFRETLDVVALTLETHQLGVALARQHNFSVYDAMIVAAAQLAGCRTLYSEDMHNGHQIGGLRVVNPFS